MIIKLGFAYQYYSWSENIITDYLLISSTIKMESDIIGFRGKKKNFNK